jgi:ferritin
MLKKSVYEAINDQINAEMYSSYLYLGMSAYCESANLKGAAQWLKVQSGEEWAHALKMYGYLYDCGNRAVLEAIDKPPVEFKSLLDVFQQVLKHEKKVTESITKLYELALKEKDYPTQIFLQFFVSEQLEEEKNATDIIEQIKTLGDNPVSIMMIDRHLGMRTAK